MIILRNEESKIVEMFDTVEEFKKYLIFWLYKTENELIESGEELTNGYLLTVPVDKANFQDKLDCYLDMTCNTIETI